MEIPIANIVAVVQGLDERALTEAVQELKSPEGFTSMLGHSSAARLIDALADLYLRQFERRVERYQESDDPAEVERLRREISQELFGS